MIDQEETRLASVGERFDVTLEATPGAGFSWRMINGPPTNGPVRLVDGVWERASRDLVGAPARQRFIFEAVARGSITLVFCYGRAWETTVKQRRQITVTVR